MRSFFVIALLLVWGYAFGQTQDQQQNNSEIEILIYKMELIEIELNGERRMIIIEDCGCEPINIQLLPAKDQKIVKQAIEIFDSLPIDSARKFEGFEKIEVLLQILDLLNEKQLKNIEKLLQEDNGNA